MKKTIALLVSLILVVFVFVSCKTTETPSSNSASDTESNIDSESNINEEENREPEREYTPSGYIYTAEELANISPVGEYVLANDIDLNGEKWTPIDFEDDVDFSGVLDGNGFSIKNAVIEYDKCAGIIVTNSGTIKNLGVENINAVLTTTGNLDYPCIGAVVAHNYGVIKNCFSTGKIKVVSNSRTFDRIGGLVGVSHSSVINCYSSVDIDAYANSSNRVGGLIGDANGIIGNSYSTGNLIVKVNENTYVGGLVGCSSAHIVNCYATGSIDVTLDASELVPYAKAFAGGIAGEAEYGSIINCFSTSTNKSNARTDGIIGEINYSVSASVKNSYYATEETDNEESTFENLHNKEWMLENLWKVEEEVWIWEEGKVPSLNFDYIKTAPTQRVTSEQDLRKLQGMVLTLDYALEQNIYLTGELKPILMNVGDFDGNGYSISNLKNSGPETGLFVFNAGEIKNLRIKSIDIALTEENVFEGENIGVVNYNAGNIIDCSFEGKISSVEQCDACIIGGIAGKNAGNIIGCSTNIDIDVKTNNGMLFGGIVGWNTRGSIKYCYSTGDIVGFTNKRSLPSARIGGIAAYCTNGSILNCYSSSNINVSVSCGATLGYAGGIAADFWGEKLENCLYLGDISFVSEDLEFTIYVDAIVGWNSKEAQVQNNYKLKTQEIKAVSNDVKTNSIGIDTTKEEINTIGFVYEKLGWKEFKIELLAIE